MRRGGFASLEPSLRGGNETRFNDNYIRGMTMIATPLEKSAPGLPPYAAAGPSAHSRLNPPESVAKETTDGEV
ncbi:MAG: hypothetical protein NVS3B20_26420 [Polyangiales bacterium]